MFPTDDCFPTLRRRALAPRPFPYAFHRTEPLTFSRRRWRFGGMSGECAGSSHPLIVPFDSEVPHLTTSEPLTPLSLPSIRGVALGAQSRARRRLPRPLLPPARETQAAFTIRGAFPRSVTQRASSGPRFRDGRSRPAPRRSHDFAAVVRRKRRLFARPLLECDCPLARTLTLKKRTLSAGPRIVFPRYGVRGLGPRSRRGTSSVEWCARRFSGPERLRTISATIPARFRAVPNSLVRNSADARAHPFERFDPRPQYRARRLGLRSRASPVSRRAFGEPDASIVGSPSPPFPAEEPELHDPPLRVGRMQMGEEPRVKDCRTSRQFPSSIALLDARVTEPSWCGNWRLPHHGRPA